MKQERVFIILEFKQLRSASCHCYLILRGEHLRGSSECQGWGWRHSLLLKCGCCSFRGREFGSQNPQRAVRHCLQLATGSGSRGSNAHFWISSFYLTYMDILHACMHACTTGVPEVLRGRRTFWNPWGWSYRWLWDANVGTGNETQSSVKQPVFSTSEQLSSSLLSLIANWRKREVEPRYYACIFIMQVWSHVESLHRFPLSRPWNSLKFAIIWIDPVEGWGGSEKAS